MGRAGRYRAMSLCALCASPTADAGLCTHHIFVFGDGSSWATGNRIMCDFLHRGVVPPTPLDLVGRSMELLLEDLEEPAAA
jgi:hypothetical protein